MMIGGLNEVRQPMSYQAIGSTSKADTISSQIEANRSKQEEEAEKIASGRRINSAADDAAGMVIAQNILSSYTQLNVMNNGIASEMNRINVGDGALSSVQDSLGRMRELTIQASNGILSDSDRKMIQGEIDQIKEYITDVSEDTTFNTQKLFDGTLGEMNLETLGLTDFDVTGNFSLDTLDAAIQQVSDMQAELGGEYNAKQHEYNNNTNTAGNLANAYNRHMNTDMGQLSMDMAIQTALQQYQMHAQFQMMNLETSGINLTI